MKIIKYIFLLCVFLNCCIIGFLLANKYKKRVYELRTFKEMVNILETKMKFTYEPLGNIFDDIINLYSDKNQLSQIFIQAKNNMKSLDVSSSWNLAIENVKENICLNKDDINIIKGLGRELGQTDIEGQIKEFELINCFLDTQIKEAEEQCKKNEKMYKTLGSIIGIALVIILI